MSRAVFLCWLLLLLTFFSEKTSLMAAESCTFSRRPSAVGDITNQTVKCDLQLEMAIRQGNQVVEAKQQEIQRSQNRKIKVVSVGKTAPQKAIVTYVSSSIQVKQQKGQQPTSAKQPVAGKSYYVTRVGKDLIITDLQGKTPPEEERLIVASNLDAFGLPNPIAKFFNGKTIHVGDTIQLPIELAKELLGFDDTVGDISDLSMRMIAIKRSGKTNAAVFETKLIAKTGNASTMNLNLNGQLAIEIDTCRTIAVNLTGPVSTEEEHGPENGKFSVTSDGRLNVAVRANYQNAKR